MSWADGFCHQSAASGGGLSAVKEVVDHLMAKAALMEGDKLSHFLGHPLLDAVGDMQTTCQVTENCFNLRAGRSMA